MSILFNGTNQTITLDTAPALSSLGAITLMCRINASSLAAGLQDLIFCSRGTSTTNSRVRLSINNTGHLEAGCRALDTDGQQTFQHASATIVANTRYYVAATFDYAAKTISLYQDGVLLSTSGALTLGATSTDTSASQATSFAARPDNLAEWYPGYLEDIRIYSRKLTALEILTVWACEGKDGIRGGTVGIWQLGEGSDGSTATGTGSIKDFSSSLAVGTPKNSPTYSIEVRTKKRRMQSS